MSTEKYKQVADLIEGAFKTLADAAKTSPAAPAEIQTDHAALQVHAAQAIATLALATEVRAVALILASGAPVGPSAELARDAFTAAAIHLDLVEDHRGTSVEDFGEDFDGDPDTGGPDGDGLYLDGGVPADDEDGDLK